MTEAILSVLRVTRGCNEHVNEFGELECRFLSEMILRTRHMIANVVAQGVVERADVGYKGVDLGMAAVEDLRGWRGVRAWRVNIA